MSKLSHLFTVWLIFLLIVGSYLLMARYFPFAYIVATYEDLVGEWAQVYFFTATMLLAIIHATKYRQFRLFYGLLALACFYVAGEEISWGQRIFDIESPEFFRQHNLQKETNLHNFLTGPISTWVKSALEFSIAAGLVFYGLIYPLALKFRLSLAQWLEGRGLPAPPLFLSPFFLLSAWLELGPFSFNEAEVAEILIPSALAVMILCALLARRDHPAGDNEIASARQAKKLALAILLLFFGVGLLAATTTWACYSTPHLRDRIDSRFLNGVEKFAGRYKRVELWENAIRLYAYVDQQEPGRPSLHRNLYRCYLPLGNTQKMQQHIDQAIDIDQRRLNNKPDSITAHVSMARNYLLLGQTDQARIFLERGMVVAKQRQAQRPNSSSTAYWLGKIYQLLGKPAKAYREFEKAVELRPNKLKYRKTLLQLQRSGFASEEINDS
jgi:tetratricopeptide (TPR) repeat protein